MFGVATKPMKHLIAVTCIVSTCTVIGILFSALGVTTLAVPQANRSVQVRALAQPVPEDHHCADLLVQTEIQLAVVHGVWNCLEPSVQSLFKGRGDRALIGRSPYFVGVRFIGCDGAMCVYALMFEATTAGVTGVSETTMTVWLDSQGLVAHAAVAKPIP